MLGYKVYFNSGGVSENLYEDDGNVSLIEISNSNQDYFQSGRVVLYNSPSSQSIGDDVSIYINNLPQFNGYVVRRESNIDRGRLVEDYQLIGRNFDLWRYGTDADAVYSGMTAFIVSSLIHDYATGISSGGITSTDGIELSEEIDLSYKSVGDAIIELTKLDGYRFYVSSNGDVMYYYPSASYSFSIEESDILEMSAIEESDEDIVNVVLVDGGSGYMSGLSKLTDTANKRYKLPYGYIAQKFKASSNKLSSINIYVESNGTPGTLEVQVWSGSSYPSSQIGSTLNLYDTNYSNTSWTGYVDFPDDIILNKGGDYWLVLSADYSEDNKYTYIAKNENGDDDSPPRFYSKSGYWNSVDITNFRWSYMDDAIGEAWFLDASNTTPGSFRIEVSGMSMNYLFSGGNDSVIYTNCDCLFNLTIEYLDLASGGSGNEPKLQVYLSSDNGASYNKITEYDGDRFQRSLLKPTYDLYDYCNPSYSFGTRVIGSGTATYSDIVGWVDNYYVRRHGVNTATGDYWKIHVDNTNLNNGLIYSSRSGTSWISGNNITPTGSIGCKFGWNKALLRVKASNQTSINNFGRYYKIVNDTSLLTLEATQAKADYEVSGSEAISKNGTFVIKGKTDMSVDYRFSSNLSNFGVDELWEVVSYTQRIDRESGFTTTIDYNKHSWDLIKHVADLEKEVF